MNELHEEIDFGVWYTNTGIKLLDKKLGWAKNPKCYNDDGTHKDMKSLYNGEDTDQLTKHGLVYDLETDKFVPVKKD